MEEKNTDIELGLEDLLGILRQCWILMLVVAMVVGGALYAFLNATHVDEYTAVATIHVGAAANGGSNAVSSSDISLATNLVNDCLVVVKDSSTLEKVISNCNLIVDDTDQFASKIKVTNKTNTRFVYVSVTAAEPEAAEDIATEVANVSCDALNGLYAGADQEKVFKVYSPGKAPDEISNPVSKLTVLLVGVAAALVIYVIYLVIFLMDDKINGPEDVEKYLQLSVLGQIPNKQDSGRKKKYYAYNADSK